MDVAKVEMKVVSAVCPTHGEYHKRIGILFGKERVISLCPQCQSDAESRSRERLVQENRQIDIQRKRQEQERRAMCYKDFMEEIPRRFSRENLFESFQFSEKSKNRNLLERFISVASGDSANGISLLLLGPAGTGKTHLGIALGQRLASAGRSVLYRHFLSFLQDLRSGFGQNVSGESALFDRVTAPDVLVLDEVGAGTGSDWESSVLFRIIDKRYADLKTTIIISNLSLDLLIDVFGEKTVSRLLDAESRSLAIVMDSESNFRYHRLTAGSKRDTKKHEGAPLSEIKTGVSRG